MTSRGLGVSQQDLDASRLVFVSVKDAKPKRKVAVPVPEGCTWDQFCGQVQTKLKLVGIGSIYLASSGERIVRLDQLQDIDELQVVEAAAPRSSGASTSGGAATLAANGYLQHHRVATADAEITAAGSDGDDSKYARRNSALQRTMRRVFPSLFQAPSLPVTSKDLGGAGGSGGAVDQFRRKIRRRRRSLADPKNLLVFFTAVSCLGTLLFVYSRSSGQGLP